MAEMKPRERVIAALNHQEPDRVPTALWGGPYGIMDEVYLKLVDLLDLGEPVAPFRKGHSVTYMDDRLLDILGTDLRYVWPGASPGSVNRATDKPDVSLDGYGQEWDYRAPHFHPGKGLLADATVAEIETLVQWPDPNEERWVVGVAERARELKENTDYYVVARMVTSHGPYMTAGHLRGVEQFLIDMALDEEFAQVLVGRVTDTIERLLIGYLEAGGKYFDLVELPGDDYATQTGMAFSPAMFRNYFKPAIKRLVDVIKEFRDDIKVMLHCDGVFTPILPDLIEIGVDVVNPLEPLPAMDPGEIKAAFGDDLSFLGAIDIKQALPGSSEDVIAEVKRRIKQLAPGGGYIIAPTNHVQLDVSPENVIALYKAAHEYGRYPIDIAAG